MVGRFGEKVQVDWAMRYGNPSIESRMTALMADGCDRILIAPMYPQYCAATTATVFDEVARVLKKMRWQPALRFVPPYHDEPSFLAALADDLTRQVRALTFKPEVMLLSFHGMPQQTLEKGDPYYCHCSKTARLLREELGAAFGTDLSQVSTTEMMDSIEYFLFPNAFFFPGISIRLCYRFRPLGPDECLHEILVLQPLPADGERPAPATPIRLAIEDSYTTVPGFALAEILDQDTDNLALQRDGAKASRKGAQTLGNYQEARIRQLQLTLDSYLAG